MSEDLDEIPRGIFSKRDRRYLTGKMDHVDDAHERVIRSEIRKRVHYAFRDLVMLWRDIDPDEREQIFENSHQGSIRYAIAYVFAEVCKLPENSRTFERSIIDGIMDGAAEHGLFADVTLDIELHEKDTEELLEKVEQDEASMDEIAWLYRCDELSMDQITVAIDS